MQYHRDGFQPGDPDILPVAPGHRHVGAPLPKTVDVLIAGSGPAGRRSEYRPAGTRLSGNGHAGTFHAGA